MKLKPASDLYIRTITAVFIAIALMAILSLPIYIFSSLLVATYIYLLKEYKLLLRLNYITISIFVISSSVLFYLNTPFLYLLIWFLAVLSLFVSLNRYLDLLTSAGCITGFFVAMKYMFTEDWYSLVWVVVLTALCDSLAYLFGKKFGKHKLCPQISPNKTIEGFMGTMILLILVLCLERFYGLNLYLECLVCLVFSVVGDLYISVLKRKNNIKDTGNILPGHGGLLDRIDSHIATVSLVWLFKHAIYI